MLELLELLETRYGFFGSGFGAAKDGRSALDGAVQRLSQGGLRRAVAVAVGDVEAAPCERRWPGGTRPPSARTAESRFQKGKPVSSCRVEHRLEGSGGVESDVSATRNS